MQPREFLDQLATLADGFRLKIESEVQAFEASREEGRRRIARVMAEDGYQFFVETYLPHYQRAGAWLQAQGIEVVYVDCPRPPSTTTGWRYTNAMIARAARINGTGCIPLEAISEDAVMGALGVNAEDLCLANRANHPGLVELKAYGRLVGALVP